MKNNKEFYIQVTVGIVLVIIYGFFNLKVSNSERFHQAVNNFKQHSSSLNIILENNQGKALYQYVESDDFETNERLLGLLNESQIADRQIGQDYCLKTKINGVAFNSCFDNEYLENNMPLRVLIKILSTKVKA